jgi:hypothetical protein
MRKFSNFVVVVASTVGLLAAASSAQAAIITAFTAPAGPYNLGNPLGSIAAVQVTKPNTYDFTFTTTGKFDVLVQMQASMFRPVQPQPLAFTLFKGVPGSGVAVASTPTLTGPAIDMVLAAGSYYLELLPADIAKNNELVSGALRVTAVPEPASWALMISGFGLLGLAARRRRSLAGAY